MSDRPIKVNVKGVDFRRGSTSWSINGKRYGISSDKRYDALLNAMHEQATQPKKKEGDNV